MPPINVIIGKRNVHLDEVLTTSGSYSNTDKAYAKLVKAKEMRKSGGKIS